MAVYDLSISGIESENHIICIAMDREGCVIAPDVCEWMWSLSGKGRENFCSLEYLKDALQAKNISREECDESFKRQVERFNNSISNSSQEKLKENLRNV